MSTSDREMMMWHSAGKSHAWIAKEFGVNKKYIKNLILKSGKSGF